MKKLMVAVVVIGLAAFSKVGQAQEIPTTLRQEMPYAQARQILLDAGWQAIYHAPTRQIFAPMDYLINELGYHEVVDCSGTGLGLCLFEFADAYGHRLSISTIRNDPRFGEPTVYAWRLEENSSSSSYPTSQSSTAQSAAGSTCHQRLKPETNVRTGPSLDSGIIATLRPPSNQDPITVHSTQVGRDGQNWSWISFNLGGDETPGWVRSDLIVCR